MSGKKKIYFIINPISGTQKKDLIIKDINRYLDNSRFDYEVKYTQYAGHAAAIAREAANAGLEGAVILNNVAGSTSSTYGYDAANDQYGDMIELEQEGRGDVLAAYVCDMIDSGPAPLEYCSRDIRDIIISARKHELLMGLEQDLLDKARENNSMEIYKR